MNAQVGFGAPGAKRAEHRTRFTRVRLTPGIRRLGRAIPRVDAAFFGRIDCGVARLNPGMHPFGWPVGSLAHVAVVVDLPLATTAVQNVFGTPETPVFFLVGRTGWQRRLSLEDTSQVLPPPALDASGA